MKGRARSGIRLRLTILYATAFFVAGALLIGLNFVLLQQSLDRSPGSGTVAAAQRFLAERGVTGRPAVIEHLLSAVAERAEEQRRETLQSMFVWSLVSLGVTGIAACGIGWLLAGRALRPLQDITETARRVADHSLHERIALTGPDDEIKDLADTFDAMLERLDRAFDGQRRFVANASHELRTPLAINRTLVEVALTDPQVPQATKELAGTLLEVNARNERLIDGLLVLATSEQRVDVRVRVDLADLARRAVGTATDAAHRMSIAMHPDLAPVRVAGDPALLERIPQNLVDNAIRYNVDAEGWVRVAVRSTGGWACLTVDNTGPAVPPAEVSDLFEPFRRFAPLARTSDHSRILGGRGAGLGLSIVRSVTNAHGGDVRAVARPGGGLTVTVRLPLAT